jgi:hypothetical protein
MVAAHLQRRRERGRGGFAHQALGHARGARRRGAMRAVRSSTVVDRLAPVAKAEPSG